MKTCRACGQEKPEDQFNWKYESKGVRCATCRDCMQAYIRDHYRRNVDYYVKKARRNNKRYHKAAQKRLHEYLSTHPCVDCGESDPIVLEFDHVDQGTKRAEVSRMVSSILSWDTITKEVAKCEVRCANCHRRRTAKQRGYYLYLAEA
jgi:hypothetical protein